MGFEPKLLANIDTFYN